MENDQAVTTQDEVAAQALPTGVLRGRVVRNFGPERSRGLGRYLAGAFISLYGDWFSTVALLVLLLKTTGSAAAPAGYMLARVLPRVLSATPGGRLADRFAAHRFVALCAVLQCVLTASVIASARAGMVWSIYGAVVLAQFCGGLARPAMGAILPRLAEREQLQRANGLYQVGFSTGIVAGPALATPLLAWRGPEVLIGVDAASFLVAALLMLTLRPRPVASGSQRRPGLAAGMWVAWHDSRLRALAACWLASGLAVTAASSILVLIAAERLGAGDRVGFLYAAVGGGAILAGFAAMRVAPRQFDRPSILAFAVLEVLGLAVLVLAHSPWAAIVPLALSGAASSVWETWGSTDLQQRVPDHLLGQLNGVMVQFNSAGMVLGALLALLVVPVAGWSTMLFATCAGALAVLAGSVVMGPSSTVLMEPQEVRRVPGTAATAAPASTRLHAVAGGE